MKIFKNTGTFSLEFLSNLAPELGTNRIAHNAFHLYPHGDLTPQHSAYKGMACSPVSF